MVLGVWHQAEHIAARVANPGDVGDGAVRVSGIALVGGRAIGLGERITEVAGQVRRAIGETPWIGYLAFGEQGCFGPGQIAHANLSLSALVLGGD